MDSIPHALHKIAIERAAALALPERPLPDCVDSDAPPPYTALPDDAHFADDHAQNGAEFEHEYDTADPSQETITLNVGTIVRGSNNIVSASSPLADATRLSTLLLATVHKLNARAEEEHLRKEPDQTRTALQVNIVINAGITIIGKRNVVGSIPIRMKPQPPPSGPLPVQAAEESKAVHEQKASISTSLKRGCPFDEDLSRTKRASRDT